MIYFSLFILPHDVLSIKTNSPWKRTGLKWYRGVKRLSKDIFMQQLWVCSAVQDRRHPLEEVQNLNTYPDLQNRNLHFNKIPRWFMSLEWLPKPKMELLLPGVLCQHLNLGNFHVPVNILLDQKCRIFCEPTPKCQANPGLTCLPLLTPNKVDCTAAANQISSIFLFQFFILYPKKPSLLLPYFAILSGWRLSTSWSVKYRFFVSPQLSSLIIF